MAERLGYLTHELPAQCLKPDIYIHDFSSNKVWTPEDLALAENHYRRAIYQKLNGDTVGKTIFIVPNHFFTIRAVTKAAWDLGCAIFNQEGHPAFRVMPEFKHFYDFIDVIIAPNPKHGSNEFLAWTVDWMPDKHIYVQTQFDDKEFHPKLPVDASSVAVRTHSSGTTGYPKIIDITHKQVMDLARHTIEYNEFTQDDLPLHNKTLHHGSLFCNFAIPLLMTCQHHHDLDLSNLPGSTAIEKMQNALDYIKSNKITRVLLPYNSARDLDKVPSVDLENNTSINVIIGPYKEQIQEIFSKFRPKQLINMFGCSELGTMMISKTTRDNLDEYHNSRFDIVNPYMDLIIEENHIKCKWKDQTDWITLGDIFDCRDGAFWYCGRATKVKKGTTMVDTNIITRYIEDKYSNNDFTIIADFEKNCLYMAVYDPVLYEQLANVNPSIEKDLGIVECLDDLALLAKTKILSGMKPNNPLLLYYFRNKNTGVSHGIV